MSAALPYAYAAPGSFVQAHGGQASYVQREIIARLRERWGGLEGRRVLELFAGSGSLALLLAREGAQVTAVEAYAPAIGLAERAAREQSLAVRTVASDAARFAERITGTKRFDAVVVNPPRRGLAPELRAALARLAVDALAYVSCNPRSLARDCAELRLLGLKLTRVEPLDMIPWSDAVEALAWLEPALPPPPRVLLETGAWLAVEKCPGEPINPANSDEPSLLGRVRRSFARAVAVDAWGNQMSGVCWFAKTPDAEPALREALRVATRELQLLVRGNLRKQGTVARGKAGSGARYKKLRDVGRHSLATALTSDADETGTLADFASIRHPVLGDAVHGDKRSNEYVEHRHGLDRAFVHCRSVELCDPSGGQLQVSCELSADLEQALESLASD